MSLFDRLVDAALATRADLAQLRPAVEKELLHHDILRTMAEMGVLQQLTFIGGTCLRACYGSNRLSEDLDFTGGAGFDKGVLPELGNRLKAMVEEKYGLPVEVSEPSRERDEAEDGAVDTWKLRVQTRPQMKSMPAQRIHIDICAVPSHDRQFQTLRNLYDIDMGTGGLIIPAQSQREILADKVVALAMRRNRLKNRDLWDIAWLHQRGIEVDVALVRQKLADRTIDPEVFLAALHARGAFVAEDEAASADFCKEMERFLPIDLVEKTVRNPQFWSFLAGLIGIIEQTMRREIGHGRGGWALGCIDRWPK
jgi:predicted nucleotidyltransferase component of viral defense system